jgi:hypothetical protein
MSDGVKALTIYQPWASFLIAGIKVDETRPRRTHFRGPVAIHAGAFRYRDLVAKLPYYDLQRLEEIALAFGLGPIQDMPRGAVLGVSTLTDCGLAICGPDGRRAVSWETSGKTRHILPCDLELGDYTVGRFAYKMVDPRQFVTPVRMGGQQGFWTIQGEDLVRVLKTPYIEWVAGPGML